MEGGWLGVFLPAEMAPALNRVFTRCLLKHVAEARRYFSFLGKYCVTSKCKNQQ